MQEEQIREALNRCFVTILSQANKSSGERICKLCGVIIQASRLALNIRRMLGTGDLWITEYTST